jgi:hypothetical protein
MKMDTCPRCKDPGLERLKTYAVCHACNWNTEEQAVWSKVARTQQLRSCTHAGPLLAMSEEIQGSPLSPRFSAIDYAVLRNSIARLPVRERQVVFLKFWKNQTSMSIAYYLNSIQLLRQSCIAHPKFSRSRTGVGQIAA